MRLTVEDDSQPYQAAVDDVSGGSRGGRRSARQTTAVRRVYLTLAQNHPPGKDVLNPLPRYLQTYRQPQRHTHTSAAARLLSAFMHRPPVKCMKGRFSFVTLSLGIRGSSTDLLIRGPSFQQSNDRRWWYSMG